MEGRVKIIRVFPRSTSATPDDADVRIDAEPGMFDECDEAHISVAFTWDIPRAEQLYKAWSQFCPTRIGGPAYGLQGGRSRAGFTSSAATRSLLAGATIAAGFAACGGARAA